MTEYQKYSRDIWDYIEDLDYMPSREDRERLFLDESKRERVQLWDYFFRIKPEDVGRPQQKEIASIRKKLDKEREEHANRVKEIPSEIKDLEKTIRQKSIKRFIIGFVLLIFWIIFITYTPLQKQVPISSALLWSIPVLLLGLMAIVGIGFVASGELSTSKALAKRIDELDILHRTKIGKAKKRLKALDEEIARLARQVPTPQPDEYIRNWLDDEINKLRVKATEEVALDRELVDIKGKNEERTENPLLVAGPGELQSEIPKQFSKEIDKDLNKYLTVKQAYLLDTQDEYEVLYSIYFIEFIIIATDMLVTYSLFYDFIDDRIRAEHITEQYYKDVVALAIVKEFRKLTQIIEVKEPVYIEDAPTFTLSLASGEKHKVTFVNQDYFMKIKEGINLQKDDIDKIGWIQRSETTANNAIKTLRYHLRQHKILLPGAEA